MLEVHGCLTLRSSRMCSRLLFVFAALSVPAVSLAFRFGVVTYSCKEIDLDWLTLLPHIPPVFRPSCHLLQDFGVSEGLGCTESHGYLQTVVENYDNLEALADILIFTHAHRTSWHYHEPVDHAIKTLMGEEDYLASNDVGVVFCNHNIVLATSDWGPSERLDQRSL